jgi:hypothetical protein
LAVLILPVLPHHLIVEVFKVLDVAAEPEVPIKLPSPGVQMEITRRSFFV